jgi:hypothetical protein
MGNAHTSLDIRFIPDLRDPHICNVNAQRKYGVEDEIHIGPPLGLRDEFQCYNRVEASEAGKTNIPEVYVLTVL